MSVRARKPAAPRATPKLKYMCTGGPFDGEIIMLTPNSGTVRTLPFSIASYNNGERGVYSGYAGSVVWEVQ